MSATKTYTPAEAIQAALNEGFVEISDGCWLNSQENIISDHAVWDEFDEAKDFDFTQAPFWITTDDGQVPSPVYNVDDEELIEILANV